MGYIYDQPEFVHRCKGKLSLKVPLNIKILHVFHIRFAGYFQSKPGSGSVPGAQHYNQRTQSGDSQGSEYRSPALKLADFARNNQETSTNGKWLQFYASFMVKSAA